MSIALIEDDEAILRSLSLLLEGRGLAVRCYGSAEAFLQAFGDGLPACVVSDIRMPGMSGMQLQQELRKRGVAVPVILITGHGDIAMAVQAIKHGAFDFIEKPFDDEQLVASIQQAIESERRNRDSQNERAVLEARMSDLSPRQVEVMWLVAEGRSNKEIALKLAISPRTVENYRAWVMEKMGASNLAELVRMAIVVKG